MRQDYLQWLKAQQYSESTQNAQIFRVKRVEEFYGNLDDHLKNGTFQQVLDNLQYSTADSRENKLNPSKIPIDGNILSNLRDYRNAVQRYYRFINESGQSTNTGDGNIVSLLENVSQQYAEEKSQRITLERDMQS